MDKEDSKEERLARRTREEQEAKMRARDDGSHRSSRFDRSSNASPMSSDARRSRMSQRAEEEQEVKRRAKESMRSPRSTKSIAFDSISSDARKSRRSRREEDEKEENASSMSSDPRRSRMSQRAKEEQEEKRRLAKPGAYSTSVDMAGGKSQRSSHRSSQGSSRRSQEEQEAKLRAKGGPDSSSDDDNSLGQTFVSAQEIHDQRTKLSVANSRSDSRKPGARPVESDRNAKARDASNAQYEQQDSSTLHLEATAVEDIFEDKRMTQLKEANKMLQQQMQEMATMQNGEAQPQPQDDGHSVVAGGAEVSEAEAVPPEDSRQSSRRFVIFGVVFLFIALAAGGAVAGIMLGGGSDDSSSAGIETSTNGRLGNPTANPTTNFPSANPTLNPTETVLFDPPTPEDCQAMSNGDAVVSQSFMITKNFTLAVDVSLVVDTDVTEFEPALQERIQRILVPEMAGCSDLSRQLVEEQDSASTKSDFSRKLGTANYVIGNGLVTVECDTEATCEEASEQPCYRCSVALELLLKGDERILNLLTIITEVFAVDSLTEVLELGQPFRRIVAVSVESGTPTEAPTPSPTPLASDPPTDAPSSGPTEVPSSTNLPSLRPSKPTPQCPPWNDWFEGPFEINVVSESAYSIGCDGFPTSILVLVSDDDYCVRCIGLLVATDFEPACKDEFGMVNFELLQPLPDEEIVYYGYESEFANSDIFIDCPSEPLTLLDPPPPPPPPPGGGGGGGPN
jgi:hypothetical protein